MRIQSIALLATLSTSALGINSFASSEPPSDAFAFCNVTEFSGRSLRDGQYTKQKTKLFYFDEKDVRQKEFRSSIVTGVSVKLLMSPSSFKSEGRRESATSLDVEMADSTLGTIQSANSNFLATSDGKSALRSVINYQRRNMDQISVLCKEVER
jgi:hypothetical protein